MLGDLREVRVNQNKGDQIHDPSWQYCGPAV